MEIPSILIKHQEQTGVHCGEELSPVWAAVAADDGMRSPGLVSPVSSVPYTSVHTMVTRLPLALLALASLLALVTTDPWVGGGWRPRGLALWVNRDTHI